MDLMLAGQRWRLDTPRPCDTGERFTDFVVPAEEPPDLHIVFQDSEPLSWPEPPLFQNSEMRFYRRDGVLWRETVGTAPIAAVAYRDGRVDGFLYPALRPHFTSVLQYFSLLGVEYLLYRQGAWMLHCSLICAGGRAVLFTAPSGTGKSTQAELWRQYEGAEIINGDRAAIRCSDGVWTAYGLPYAGSSAIYRRRQAPIAAIVVLGQAPDNRVRRMRGAEAFRALYEQTTVHPWNPQFQRDTTFYLQQLLSAVPAYRLDCTPDRRAVDCLKEAFSWYQRV